jgi:hypothetical protein
LCVTAALSAALLFPSAASADTIRIVSGFFEVGDHFEVRPFNLVGDSHGFTLFGRVGNPGFDPFCNDAPDCAPGDTARITQVWNGLDFPGANATYEGVTYTEMNNLSSIAFAEVGFNNTLVLPAFEGTTGVLQTPFVMAGTFTLNFEASPLVGSGTMTTTWNRRDSPEGSRWVLALTRYDFADSAAPVPEPTTLVLTGLAGAAAAFRRRKRRTQ